MIEDNPYTPPGFVDLERLPMSEEKKVLLTLSIYGIATVTVSVIYLIINAQQ